MSQANGTTSQAQKESAKRTVAEQISGLQSLIFAAIDKGDAWRMTSRREPPLPGNPKSGAQQIIFSFGQPLRPKIRDVITDLTNFLEGAVDFEVKPVLDDKGRKIGVTIEVK